jgi:Rab-GTPase-TBC domain
MFPSHLTPFPSASRMNCLLLRELPLKAILRLWDTYLSEETGGFENFHVYVCAVLLKTFKEKLMAMVSNTYCYFLPYSTEFGIKCPALRFASFSMSELQVEYLICSAAIYLTYLIFHSLLKGFPGDLDVSARHAHCRVGRRGGGASAFSGLHTEHAL